MADYSKTPSGKDTHLNRSNNTTNYGSEAALELNDSAPASSTTRIILYFDISDFHGGTGTSTDVADATFKIYHYANSRTLSDPTVWVYKLTNDAWVELEATWDIYSTGNNWTSGGGDYVTSNPAGDTQELSAGDPATPEWVSFDVTDIVKDALDNESGHLNLLMKFEAETGNGDKPYFYSKDESTETTKRPTIEINYATLTASVSDTLAVSEDHTNKSILSASDNISLSDGSSEKQINSYQTKHSANWTYQDKNG